MGSASSATRSNSRIKIPFAGRRNHTTNQSIFTGLGDASLQDETSGSTHLNGDQQTPPTNTSKSQQRYIQSTSSPNPSSIIHHSSQETITSEMPTDPPKQYTPSTQQQMNAVDITLQSVSPKSSLQIYEGSRVTKPIDEDTQWRIGSLLGAGSYGRVYLGLNIATGELFAAKQFPVLINDEEQNRMIEAALRETQVMKDLIHPNIVRFLGYRRMEDFFYVFMEYIPGGSLSSLLHRFGPLPEKLVQIYTKQIVTGVEYLHSKGIVHRDIKGANILVDVDGSVKLADFGASIRTDNTLHSIRGTPNWMAPESVKSHVQGREGDIWSIGCTVIEMLSAKPPWFHVGESTSILYHIASTSKLPRIPSSASSDAHMFIISCLKREPTERPPASALARMSFISPSMESLIASVKTFPVVFQEFFRDDRMNGTLLSIKEGNLPS